MGARMIVTIDHMVVIGITSTVVAAAVVSEIAMMFAMVMMEF